MSHQSSNMGMVVVAIILGLLLTAAVLTGGVWAREEAVGCASSADASSREGMGFPAAQAVISPTSDFVLFERPDGLNSTIWLLTDGVTQTQIITGQRPRLSHDGRSIIYLAGDADPIYSDIYVYDLATGTSTHLFANWDSIVYYSWATDDSRIFYDFRCHIYAMDPDGSDNQQITTGWPDSGIDYCWNDNPDVNPVDGRLAWENEHYGLAVADADGSNPTWITNTQPGDFQPRWSPDGAWIAFFRDSDAADDDNFFKIRPDGTGLTKLTSLAGDDANEMEYLGGWTPDGDYVVGTGEVNGIQAIYAVSADGSQLMAPLLKENGADLYFVGGIGDVEIVFHKVYLPLILVNS